MAVHVTGIRDLQAALRDVDKDLAKELRVGFNEVARIVVDAARPKVPRRSGAAQASMKPRSTQRAAGIAVGGTKAPYYGWLEFGGTVGKGRVAGGAKKKALVAGAGKRPYVVGGRYIYPTLHDKRPEIDAKVDEVMGRLAARAGFETGGTA